MTTTNSDLEGRVDALEARVAQLEGGRESLLEILRAYRRGGIPGLVAATHTTRSVLYRFANGQGRSFPEALATQLVQLYGFSRVGGRRVSMRRLRLAWKTANSRLGEELQDAEG